MRWGCGKSRSLELGACTCTTCYSGRLGLALSQYYPHTLFCTTHHHHHHHHHYQSNIHCHDRYHGCSCLLVLYLCREWYCRETVVDCSFCCLHTLRRFTLASASCMRRLSDKNTDTHVVSYSFVVLLILLLLLSRYLSVNGVCGSLMLRL